MMKPLYTRKSVQTYTHEQMRKIENLFIREFIILGEAGVNAAREQHDYTDQTSNLTSSIGYELYINGKIYRENFEAYQGGSESGEEGVLKGKALAAELGPMGNYTLIFVAGMEYAEEVELRGKNVLSPAYLLAEQEIPKIKERILRLVNK